MTVGTIFKIKRYALHDGPGIRTTVFFKGCPLSCRWCHNPEGIDPQAQTMSRRTASGDIDETVGTVIGVEALVNVIEKDVLFYDESRGGVTFSGGEPLGQPAFLDALLAACNHRDIHAALDTSGFAPAAVVDRVLPRLQLVLFDLKIMDPDRHRRYTGVSNRIILENLTRIAGSGTPVRIRIPVIPGMTDGDGNLTAIVRFASTLKALDGIDLLPFHRIGEGKYRRLGLVDPMAGAAPPSPARMAEIKDFFDRAGVAATIGG
ncbi:formate acetyltransferase activating enzyme [Desulfosarcina alkanivorans]|uniref:Formate acetyltransferase activating enzyme n=1 Tax=Desulfosarcina alkanivorans TaxID=571177 RepID=A0A5K7YS46_9BACT|nr:glycyl-radical enzyme activating protein [Desulfosarcina alkanivorans]BBO70759.1 formate acetyltransferase activating enzyme [Desulfosarcina alkanivorans]